MKTLADIGEFGLIERIRKRIQERGLAGFQSNKDLVGIGDDCAVIPSGDDELELITTDMLLEDSHFRLDWISPEDLGYKSLAVNLSDIAAMGGTPTSVFLSIGLPLDTSLEWVDRFFDGFLGLAQEYGVVLMGGDTTKSLHGVVINVVVRGTVTRDALTLRSAAKPEQLVAVSGRLGESGAGLKWLMEHRPERNVDSPLTNGRLNDNIRHCIHAHYRPELYMKEAQWLARQTGIGAMLDLSDGVLSDARHIAEESNVSIHIEMEKIPVSEPLREVCLEQDWDSEALALAAGEDYGLLFTVDADRAEELVKKFEEEFSSPIHLIGRVSERTSEGLIHLLKNGTPYILSDGQTHGFDHFKTI